MLPLCPRPGFLNWSVLTDHWAILVNCAAGLVRCCRWWLGRQQASSLARAPPCQEAHRGVREQCLLGDASFLPRALTSPKGIRLREGKGLTGQRDQSDSRRLVSLSRENPGSPALRGSLGHMNLSGTSVPAVRWDLSGGQGGDKTKRISNSGWYREQICIH